jgi:hypothetical protein
VMANVWALFVVFLVVIGAVGLKVLHETVRGATWRRRSFSGSSHRRSRSALNDGRSQRLT